MKIPFFLIAGCLAAFSLVNAQGATIQVQVGPNGGFTFSPKDVSIQVGDTILWKFLADDHSATSGTPGHPDGVFDSGIKSKGTTFSQTFGTPGVFNYYCLPHGACCGMVGSVTVAAASDTVTITRAQYTSTRSQLTVSATDSNTTAVLTASVTSTGMVLGPLRGSNGSYSAKFTVTSNPVNITVTSNLGGSASAPVKGR